MDDSVLTVDDFSPRQVARALGVSESSLKRWCDRGLLPMHRTAGGHRRLRAADVLSFVRTGKHQLVQPELLGLVARVGKEQLTIERAREAVLNALQKGDQEVVTAVGMRLYTSSVPLPAIFDQVYAPALHAIGEQWECHSLQVFEERRGVALVMQLLAELRRILPDPVEEVPLALAAACEGDHYSVPVAMTELVLREAGWNARLLGSNIPVVSLIEAVARQRPKMLCLSLSYIDDRQRLIKEMDALAGRASEQGTSIVVGGQALSESVRKELRYTAFCEDLTHLVPLARSLWSAEKSS